jgi:hypothetical protein
MKDETEYVSGIESTEGVPGRSCKFQLFITVPVMNSVELPREGSPMINDHQDRDTRQTKRTRERRTSRTIELTEKYPEHTFGFSCRILQSRYAIITARGFFKLKP